MFLNWTHHVRIYGWISNSRCTIQTTPKNLYNKKTKSQAYDTWSRACRRWSPVDPVHREPAGPTRTAPNLEGRGEPAYLAKQVRTNKRRRKIWETRRLLPKKKSNQVPSKRTGERARRARETRGGQLTRGPTGSTRGKATRDGDGAVY